MLTEERMGGLEAVPRVAGRRRVPGTSVRSRRGPAVGLLAAVVAVAALGCSDHGPLPALDEPVVVLDLVDGFAAATSENTGSGGSGQVPYVNPDRRVLHVPMGWEVMYELDVPPGAALVSREGKVLGTAVGRLEAVWSPRKGPRRVLTRDLTAAPDRSAPFGNRRRESGRLLLQARAAGGSDHPQFGVRVIEPVVKAGFAVGAEAGAELPDRDRPNIVVYLIDALRADRLGCYGYDRGTTPNIDAFASSAVFFSRAQAQTSWTRPAVASIFTGLLPQQHRAIDKSDLLPEEAVTLAELLAADGYETSAVISNGNVARAFGFAQGFDHFKHLEQVTAVSEVVRSDDVNKAVFDWLDEGRGSAPFFLYIHTVDPHLPYDPPPPFRNRFAAAVDDPAVGSTEMVNELPGRPERATPELIGQLNDLYDAEVAANDASFGELLAGLEQRGLADRTVVVLVSDHGEEFFDHNGWTHGNTLFAEMLDVPLMVRVPGVSARTVPEIVQHVDLFPTLLELAGASAAPEVFGRSVVPLWADATSVEWVNRGVSHLDIKERFAISWVDPEWKLLDRRLTHDSIRTYLFDRRNDPTEKTDLASRYPELVQRLRGRYRDTVEAAGPSLTGVEVDAEHEAEVEAQLKALGYL